MEKENKSQTRRTYIYKIQEVKKKPKKEKYFY